ncbi:MAG TPA: amidase family protein, partial [Pyrinomonadaceae bacterium]|nr:amidase family protein [Pyrinomonadaceae bacterium]
MPNFFDNDIETLRERMMGRETTARAIVESALDAAEKLNEALNAFLQIDREGALRRAGEVDAASSSTDSLPTLNGIPVAIKDNICVRGLQTSCGSRILGDYHAPYDATVIERLNRAGAVIIGKT